MKKLKITYKTLPVLVLMILIGGVLFIKYTSIGYKMTIPVWGYIEIEDNVYIDENFTGDSSQISGLLDKANIRLEEFWGEVKSKPHIIISDNEKNLKRLGWTGNPALANTTIFFGAHSYIVISPKGLNIDVIAHELTHAELHCRVYKGKLSAKSLIPVWFDEGIATQNDYRPKYNREAWQRVTEGGNKITDFSEIKEPAKFYNPDINVRRYNYIISKHEVKGWLDTHGIENLISLINDLNVGKPFNELYNKE